MHSLIRAIWFLPCLLGATLACTSARPSRGVDGSLAARNPPELTSATQLAQRTPSLLAIQWMQTSAEYEALCRQTYALATRHVLERAAQHAGRPPAVVLDLDETVIDNGWYAVQLLREGRAGWDPQVWSAYVNQHPDKARAVPGAVEFILAMRKAGIAVFYVTNRTEAERAGTIAALEKLGIGGDNLSDPALLRLQMKDKTSSKDGRRARIAAQYQILALIGDNLGDLSGIFDKNGGPQDAEARRKRVAEHATEFGAQWFVLPNPLYGEWEKFLNKQDVFTDLYH